MIGHARWPQYRWNASLWVVETAAWMMATAFIDTTTVLPVLIQALTASPLLASAIISIRYAGQGWPQLIAASVVSGKRDKKGWYLLATIPGRLLLIVPALLLLGGVTAPVLTVTAIMVAYLAFWVSEGFSIVPWTEMLGKTIPPARRGRLFASMHVLGGLLGIVAGLVVRAVLGSSRFPFPVGYGLLFLFALAGLLTSTLSLGLLREPPSPPHEERYSTLALIKDIPNLLRSSSQFRLLVLVQALFGFSILPAPLYILLASSLLAGVSQTGSSAAFGVGTFLAVQTSGMIFGNALWGFLNDRFGTRLLLRVLAVAHSLVPLAAVAAGVLGERAATPTVIYLAFIPVFVIYGSLQGGTWMGVTNFILEIAPAHDRPAYIAVMNALNIPAIILPLVGGLLVHALGYIAIFAIAAVFLLVSWMLTAELHEPREQVLLRHERQREEEARGTEDW